MGNDRWQTGEYWRGDWKGWELAGEVGKELVYCPLPCSEDGFSVTTELPLAVAP